MFATILSALYSILVIWCSINAIVTIINIVRLFIAIGKHGWINAGKILMCQKSIVLKSWGSVLLVAGYGNLAFRALIAGSLVALLVASFLFLICAIKGSVNLVVITIYLVFCLLAGWWLQAWTRAGISCLKAHRSTNVTRN